MLEILMQRRWYFCVTTKFTSELSSKGKNGMFTHKKVLSIGSTFLRAELDEKRPF